MKKDTIIWVVVAVLVVLGIWIVSRSDEPTSNNDSQVVLSSTPVSTGVIAKPKATPKVSGETMTYTQAVVAYQGKRIQFNESCQGNPGQVALKKGDKIMLDNRSSMQISLAMDGRENIIPAYGWKIVTVTTANALPYNLGIHCTSSRDSVGNAALINLQASMSQGL
ncbi:MAG: hypothetical protein UW46_C0007G0024 [Candidatus Yanofskybacteria bacterium GW2011_GWF1_44_227]|uniref:Uncharacterized protein n=1 Tax=Candidatus Yanofskybacteria bacterium GW2011_GWE2_40_11 TaxID=1619033 RepID=A0A0G0SYT3_9BACT|nr:MAG: hypothetical protein UT69_C0014G0004 [Candidatus Yanofskybacteria bacterium GW2011_GWE1_40_10]KKR39995.1 MAG: hypothetical protein UT75_C0011G0023 [Candidatus Yanofskybacteria bacterium GW2011_GWE2_40_11]KKT15364.1 MAG: hypothetical protein UV97_C0008G0013 [Candidatus Yanofskybacteria bacterium GW2011_GWF2_43_596]KKT53048.1 MAG: hypothetical protein UW46_C0007G0024 [Candidatus Yanofskybacteria bacterium GW2011_GWF1_44_227]OGN35730.1 MAG: hypothetical protein A2241_02495 [Candidatus Yano